jgi:NAD(P)-dependent dehydrogenase (short-subunit alcohol dehydrogenase family)
LILVRYFALARLARHVRWYARAVGTERGLNHSDALAELQNIFAVNAFGPFYTARALIRAWLALKTSVDPASHTALSQYKDKGRILEGKQVLFVSSISGLVAMSPQNQSAYNASKAALTMMAKVNPSFGILCGPRLITGTESRWRMGASRRQRQCYFTCKSLFPGTDNR